jgi:hypothetical protein
MYTQILPLKTVRLILAGALPGLGRSLTKSSINWHKINFGFINGRIEFPIDKL